MSQATQQFAVYYRSQQPMNPENLKAHFLRCEATSAEVAGGLIITTWKHPFLADKCADTMLVASVDDIEHATHADIEYKIWLTVK